MIDPILKEAVNFHGHLCPGLAIGYKACLLANLHGFKKSSDEEMIAVVENNSCSVDAIQYLLSCTFGKGNLYFKDHGKQVFTIIKRDTLESIRLSFKSGIRRDDMSRDDFLNVLLTSSPEQLFNFKKFNILKSDLPQKAVIYKSVLCDGCGETTMDIRIKNYNGKNLCISCYISETEKR